MSTYMTTSQLERIPGNNNTKYQTLVSDINIQY